MAAAATPEKNARMDSSLLNDGGVALPALVIASRHAAGSGAVDSDIKRLHHTV